ncbi:MAG TPA: HNH endonuclease [Chitinophagales bacterium]|nr:HNH endonuclease [Chitinophagales bacterium]
MKFQPGDIISHTQMCLAENLSLQRGMNFKVRGSTSIILMSTRKGAPYEDKLESGGQTLIYEGHDVPRTKNLKGSPKFIDQPMETAYGKLTENGKFFKAAQEYKSSGTVELVKVYEKIKDGIWVYNGVFQLIDAWVEQASKRNVFKFKLRITEKDVTATKFADDLVHNRMIPSHVKVEVWKRDKGQCVECGSKNNLHFDHILPFSKGGTSLRAENIQLLCARHNLQKHDKLI